MPHEPRSHAIVEVHLPPVDRNKEPRIYDGETYYPRTDGSYMTAGGVLMREYVKDSPIWHEQ